MSAERWAAPEPALVPSGAEPGHMAPGGRHVPAEELRHCPQRGLQDRLGLPAFSGARLGEGQVHGGAIVAAPREKARAWPVTGSVNEIARATSCSGASKRGGFSCGCSTG